MKPKQDLQSRFIQETETGTEAGSHLTSAEISKRWNNAVQPQTKNHGRLPTRRSNMPAMLALVLIAMACAATVATGSTSPLSLVGSEAGYPESVPKPSPSQIYLVGRRIWNEFSWFAVPLFFIMGVKVVLLRQSASEVVACLLDIVAFLLLNGIEVVRRSAIELHRLARDLRVSD